MGLEIGRQRAVDGGHVFFQVFEDTFAPDNHVNKLTYFSPEVNDLGEQ
jgi:hypothetical protein